MKILHITTLDSGGASKACLNLHRGLLKIGVESKVLILFRRKEKEDEVYEFFESSDDNFLTHKYHFAKRAFEYIKNKVMLFGHSDEYEVFSGPKSCVDITSHPLYEWADLVNLHWVGYILDYKKYFSKDKPTVWRTSDMNSFTGGCHITAGCEEFKKSCEVCPQLEGTLVNNYAKKNFLIKQNALKDFTNLNIVGVSSWISQQAQQSTLFKKYNHHVIHNGIDTAVYYPEDKKEAKLTLNLPLEKKVIFYVADDLKRKNKGYHLLKETLEKLDNPSDYLLMVAGRGTDDFVLSNNIEIKLLGFISSKDKLRQAYSAADLTVIPSLYETFNQVTLESMACGTPSLAWDNSGPRDIIEHKETGYLARAYDTDDMKIGIEWVLSDGGFHASLSNKSFKRAVEFFSQELQAKRYKELYESILS